MTLPAVTGFEELHLRFMQWLSYTTDADSGQVQIQVWDDVTQTWLAWENVGTSVQLLSGWSLKDIDLTTFSGQTVRLGFMHTDNSFSQSTGWYIDDITITIF